MLAHAGMTQAVPGTASGIVVTALRLAYFHFHWQWNSQPRRPRALRLALLFHQWHSPSLVIERNGDVAIGQHAGPTLRGRARGVVEAKAHLPQRVLLPANEEVT